MFQDGIDKLEAEIKQCQEALYKVAEGKESGNESEEDFVEPTPRKDNTSCIARWSLNKEFVVGNMTGIHAKIVWLIKMQLVAQINIYGDSSANLLKVYWHFNFFCILSLWLLYIKSDIAL